MPTRPPDLHPQYVTDENGEPTAALLPIAEYRQIVELIEDIEDSLTLEDAHDHPVVPVPFGDVVQRLRADGLLDG